jgi:hypothetical protein
MTILCVCMYEYILPVHNKYILNKRNTLLDADVSDGLETDWEKSS